MAVGPIPAASSQAERPRTLVTGASGFLGSALVRRLRRRGDRLRVLVRRHVPELAADLDVDVVVGDLGDSDVVDRAVRDMELVYHVGAAMSGDHDAFQAGTVRGTKHIVAACLRHRVTRLVYVSSISVLDHGTRPRTGMIDETHPLEAHPALRGSYTQAKLDAERAVRSAMTDHGLPAVILRPGQIVGRGSEKFSPAGAIAFGGRWIVIGDGRQLVPAVFIEDVVDALLLAAERDDIAGSTFHVVDTVDRVTQNDYIHACRRVLGPTLRVTYVPAPLMMVAASLVGFAGVFMKAGPPLSPYRLKSSRPLGPFDPREAHERLGWLPRIGARRGLECMSDIQTAHRAL